LDEKQDRNEQRCQAKRDVRRRIHRVIGTKKWLAFLGNGNITILKDRRNK
jgi:hypothetical protein